MFARLNIYLHKSVYDHKNTDANFIKAVRKNVAFHKKHCQEYRKLLSKMKFLPSELKSMEDLDKLPPLSTAYLKKTHLLSMNKYRLPVKATSSGTSGNKSQLGFNALGLFYAAVMTCKLTHFHKLLSLKRTNYIILGYEPHPGNRTMVSKTQRFTTLFAPPGKRVYALKYSVAGYTADFEAVKKSLASYARKGDPVRLVGLPAYMLFMLRELQKSQITYRLPEGSMVLLGGGWKDLYREKVEKEELYRLTGEVLGIREENCREFFGAAEHPTLYCSCPNHHFHIPNYSRVIIRDVGTMKKVPDGEMGLVNLITPLADSMPLTSIMTDDLGILHAGKSCGCGIATPYLEIIGRVGVKTIQTCAVSARDFIKDERK